MLQPPTSRPGQLQSLDLHLRFTFVLHMYDKAKKSLDLHNTPVISQIPFENGISSS